MLAAFAEAADTQALLDACAASYRPHQIMAYGNGQAPRLTPSLGAHSNPGCQACDFVERIIRI
jgi:hypothetical protein